MKNIYINLMENTKNHLASNQLLLALNELNRIFENVPQNPLLINYHNNAILLKARYIELEQKNTRGVLSTEEYQRIRNQISSSILNTVDLVKTTLEKRNINQIDEGVSLPTEEIEIVINKSLIEFSLEEQAKLLSAIEKLASINGTIKITRIKEGSIIIRIEIPKSKVELVIDKINKGELDDFAVSKVLRIGDSRNSISPKGSTDNIGSFSIGGGSISSGNLMSINN